MMAATHNRHSTLPAILVGLTASLAGIGLARFAYTPLIPAIVDAGWFTTSAAAYLGAANLLGYFIGAMTGHAVSERWGARRTLCLSFAAVTLSFFLCAQSAPFAWFFVWRLVAGVTGAWLIVVAPATALAVTDTPQRPAVGTLAFMGIGLGALMSAIVVPLLLQAGVWIAWVVLGGLALIAGIIGDIALRHLPRSAENSATATTHAAGSGRAVRWIAILVIGAYACDGFGYVPHTVFWVDYLAREAGLGMTAANLQWGLFGIGAVSGPLITRFVVLRLGWQTSLNAGFVLKCLAVGLPLLTIAPLARSASSLLVGALVPGIVAMTSGRLAELVEPTEHKRLWGQATAAFALAQAAAGYGMTGLYTLLGSYRPLFGVGAALLAVAAVLVWWAGRHEPEHKGT